jgi:lycopene cyclase domain-containing protein
VSYLQFDLLFLLAPAAVLLASLGNRVLERALPVVAGVAIAGMLYLVPWSHWLFTTGLWDYGVDTTQGLVWSVPWEAYLFVLLQGAFTAAVTIVVLVRLPWKA